jgi:hypothetical protein
LKAARLRAVFLLRFFSRMAVSYRVGRVGQCSVTVRSIIDRPCQGAQPDAVGSRTSRYSSPTEERGELALPGFSTSDYGPGFGLLGSEGIALRNS